MHKTKIRAGAAVAVLALFVAYLTGAGPASASTDWERATDGKTVTVGAWHKGGPAAPGKWAFQKKDPHAKKPRVAPPSPFTGPGYYYGGAVQTGVNITGIASKITVENPYVEPNPSEHSLMELALNYSGNNDTIEWGWVKDLSGAGGPRLFAGYWVAGVWQNCYFGCAAWHDNGSNPIDIGADLTSVAAACNGTTTLGCVKQFQVNYDNTPCGPAPHGWYFYYDNVNVGCLQSNAVAGMTTADAAYAFSEVYYNGTNPKPRTDMGNGKAGSLAVLSASGPAWFGSVSYLPNTITPNLAMNTDTDKPAYSSASVGSAGNRSFAGGSGAGYKLSSGVWVTPGDIGS